MTFEIKMPQLCQTSDEVRLIKWLVRQGDVVNRGQTLCEVETDKVVMELESMESGTVVKLMAQPDTQVKTDEVVALIEPLSKKSALAVDNEKPGSSSEIEVSIIQKGNLTGIIETTSINEKDIQEKEGGMSNRTSFDEARHLATAKVRLLGLSEKKKSRITL